MPSIIKKTQVFNTSLKCVTNDGTWAGGSNNILKNIKNGLEIKTSSFVNSMIEYDDGLIFGLSDGKIGMLNNDNKEEFINLHSGNICTIDTYNHCILTGSWDHFAVLLIPTQRDRAEICLNGHYYVKKVFHHPETVWKVLFINETTFITGCADAKIRIYKDYTIYREISYHSHVVRSLLIEWKSDIKKTDDVKNTVNMKNNNRLVDFIFSIDNYGTLIKSKFNGSIIASRNLDEMCFSLCHYNDFIIVAGEAGSVFVLDKNLVVYSKTKLPCSTCWSVKSFDDQILVTGSDGILYYLSTEDLKNSMDYSDNLTDNLSGKTIKDGMFVSGGIRYKIEDGNIYQDLGSHWELIGDACDSPKKTHSFDVELDDKKYTLSFNDDDNPSDVATNFIHKNKINPGYHQEIVDYINQNFRRDTLFKKFEKIDLDGISKFLGDHPIINILRDVSNGQRYSIINSDEKNVYEIERILKSLEKDKFFVCLDICKYLFFKKVLIDLSFLFNSKIINKKEAKAFAFLLTNMVENPPFDLSKLDFEIRRLVDCRLLTFDDIISYEENRSIKMRLN